MSSEQPGLHRKICLNKNQKEPSIVAQVCNPSTWEVEAGRSGVQGYLQLHREFKASLNLKILVAAGTHSALCRELHTAFWIPNMMGTLRVRKQLTSHSVLHRGKWNTLRT